MTDCHYNPYHIYSSAVRSTAIEQCVSGHFTSEIDLNLIVAKNSRLEIFLVTPEGLSQMEEVKIYGKIAVMLLFRPQNSLKDSLFILTNRYNAMILESKFIDNELEIHTRAHGNVADRIGKISENGIIAVIDPYGRVICLRLCDGLLKIIQLDNNSNELKAVNMRIEETEIQDLNFLYGCINPTIILLHQDQLGRHIKTHEFCLKEKEFIKVPWKQDNIEREASIIIPVPEPLCGAVIIGQESILYHDDLSRNDMERIVKDLKSSLPSCHIGAGDGCLSKEDVPTEQITVDDIIKIVEDLTRLH
ncbi:hypothetical protein O3M35_002639 [Rhynocoris fuscipes]|uniref:RSE1/DDB1/CPSF1 first beta-propeller domain-containing protein n=1 Tax=Rhynocoris fuscipes TaxID=488301 RepID=A0AAW1CL01_9HEMI